MASIVLEDWMIERGDLQGLELIAFALIYGCTQNGDGCWYGGYDSLAKRIGGKQRGTINAVNRLEAMGAVERFDAMIEGKPRKAIKTIWDSAQNADAQNADAQNAEKTLHKMQSEPAQNAEPSNRKEIKYKKQVYTDEVERIYKLYPTVCPTKGRVIKKGDMCKKQIVELLKTYSAEELERLITNYVAACKTQGLWMQDFLTFLHQRPEYEMPEPSPQGDLFAQTAPQQEAPAKQKTVTLSDLRGWYQEGDPEEKWQQKLPYIIQNYENNGYTIIYDEKQHNPTRGHTTSGN